MVGFSAGRGDILLATSIIESGLDVPRANTMVVLGPDRFGLTQLHQLRGRVGRGHARSYCYLMTEPGAALSEAAERRLGTLAMLERLGSGLEISVRDLDQRGAGELFGDRQTGHARLIGLGLYQELLAAAIREARGEPHPSAEVTLQIDAAGVIPEAYVPEPIARINLYQRLARTRSLAEADGLADEIADRFGPLPPPLEALLQAARIRALAATLGVTRIAAGPDGIALTFEPRVDVAGRYADTLERLGEVIDWNGKRMLLRAPSDTPEAARDLALDFLAQLF
jgi:transcription-repair coupling factor (superfamily II helicase)